MDKKNIPKILYRYVLEGKICVIHNFFLAYSKFGYKITDPQTATDGFATQKLII